MNVLVTGASGFFGRAVVSRLHAGGHQVTELSRTGEFAVDLTDAIATRAALTPWRWDAVVHLAGPAPKGEQTWNATADTIRAHVGMLAHLLSAIPAGWGGRFVQASGAIVYGIPDTDLVREDHPRRPLHGYALAKVLTEDLVLGSSLTDRWILRSGGLFSTERRSGALFAFAQRAAAGETLRVSAPMPWEIVHIDDAAAAAVRALASSTRDPGAINVGYGESVHMVEIARRFAERARRGSEVVLEGPSPPSFRADVAKLRVTIGPLASTLGDRLDELARSV